MLQPKRLQKRLTIYLILPVAILLILMGIVGFVYARNLILAQWREAAILKLQRAAHQVDMRLGNVKEWIRIFHETPEAQDPQALYELAVKKLKEQVGVDNVHLAWHDPPTSSAELPMGRMPAPSRMYGMPYKDQMRQHMEMMRRFHSARIREITPPRFDEAIDHETVSLVSDLSDERGQSIGRLEVVINFDMLIKHVRESGWWQSNKAYLVTEDGLVELSEGQIIVIGTDGLWETHDEGGAMFGKDRLEAIIRERAQAPAERILASIIQAVQEFRGSAKQKDDITLAVIKVVGGATKGN
jgi:sigma-B regulation protein RsbU (phosphoserine phosphatase)